MLTQTTAPATTVADAFLDEVITSWQGADERRIAIAERDEHAYSSADAVADAEAGKPDLERAACNDSYRNALIGKLLELAKPEIGRRHAASCFAYGYVDSPNPSYNDEW